MTFVLDASALLAVLQNEPGAELVLPQLEKSEASVINVAEVLNKGAEFGVPPEVTLEVLGTFRFRTRAFREAHALAVARLRPVTMHLGLSFGDRACIAQAELSGRPILTTDARMAKADLGIDIHLIR